MSKKGKQFTILLIICAVCLAVYCTILIVSSINEKKLAETPIERVVNLEDIAAISFFNGKEMYSFSLEDGSWVYEALPDFPISRNYIKHISTTALELVAAREFEIVDSLDSYGLANPTKTITVTDSSGNSVTLDFGNAVNDSYYAMQPNGEVIYVIPADLVDAISYDLYNMIELEKVPTVKESNTESFTITMGSSTVKFEKETSTEEVEKTDDTTGETTVEEETVYNWYATYNNGERLPVSNFEAKFKNDTESDLKVNGYIDYLMKSLNYYSITSCENYKASDGEFSELGFDEPTAIITVNYTSDGEEKAYTLHVGSYFEVETQDDGGDPVLEGYYYVNLDGSQAINHMLSTDLVRFITAVSTLDATV